MISIGGADGWKDRVPVPNAQRCACDADLRRLTRCLADVGRSSDRQLPLREVPAVVLLHEPVEVPDRSDHQTSAGTLDLHVMREAVGYARCRFPLPRNRALAVEVRRGLIGAEVLEDGAQTFATADLLRDLVGRRYQRRWRLRVIQFTLSHF